MKYLHNSSSGQIVIILLLAMLVALSVGLVVTQRSITDVTTSTQTDQATRAFSAAEAGIEQAIESGNSTGATPLPLGNNSSVSVNVDTLPKSGSAQVIEYPKSGFKKDTIAQFWLANLDSMAVPIQSYYSGNQLDVYFGNPELLTNNNIGTDPAVQVTIITLGKDSSNKDAYYSDKHTIESNVTRAKANNFNELVTCNGPAVNTTSTVSSAFFCKSTITIRDKTGSPCNAINNCTPVMVRVRLLYSPTPQKLALGPVSLPCSNNPCFPPQVQIFKSVGTSGQSQKTIEVFRLKKYVPIWFDFAIFSAGPINK